MRPAAIGGPSTSKKLPEAICANTCSGSPPLESATAVNPAAATPSNTTFLSRTSRALSREMAPSGVTTPSRTSVVTIRARRDASRTGSGLRSTAFTSVKMVVFAPMPRASDRATTAVIAGLRNSSRAPYLRSCNSTAMSPSVSPCLVQLRSLYDASRARVRRFLDDAAA